MQRFHRVLGEVTDAQIRMCAALACQRCQFAHQGLDQGGLTRAIGPQQPDPITRFQAETDIVQDDRGGVTPIRPSGTFPRTRGKGCGRGIAGFHVIEPDQRKRQPIGPRELDAKLALGAHRLGAGHLGQALHAALRLGRLAGLRLEAVDEALQMRALGLFLVMRDLLLPQMFDALAFEIGVATDIQLGGATMQVQGVGGHVVEKFAVMRNQQQRARVLEQPLLQPQHRIHVQVVGWFVEQQQVAGHHQRARQIQPHAPAAGERRHRAMVRVCRKSQTVQQLAGARFGVVGADLGHLLVCVGHRLPVFARSGCGFFLQHRGDLDVPTQYERQRRVGQGRGFLRNAGRAHLAGQIDIALVGLQLALHRSEQARLAGAVTADHTDAVAGVHGQVDVGEQQTLAASHGEVTQGNH